MARLEHVATFEQQEEADAARVALERRGIEAELEPDREPDPRRIELRVAPEDVDEADVVINELYGVAYAERVWPRVVEDAPPPVQTSCPECGAREVRRIPKLRIFVFAVIGMLILHAVSGGLVGLSGFFFVAAVGIALTVLEPYRCGDCNAGWR
ncbi:MAG TPA: hypothetical protein VGR02_14045 [Thermoanaerobaculia bacterium]|nr:hypothetical protein [Thermoanaerobaculia bacterium]